MKRKSRHLFQRFLNNELANTAHSVSGQKYINRLKQASLVERIIGGKMRWYWGDVFVYADAPEKILAPVSDRSTHLSPQLLPYIDSATRELVMFSPYLVPGKEGVNYFSDLVSRVLEWC